MVINNIISTHRMALLDLGGGSAGRYRPRADVGTISFDSDIVGLANHLPDDLGAAAGLGFGIVVKVDNLVWKIDRSLDVDLRIFAERCWCRCGRR